MKNNVKKESLISELSNIEKDINIIKKFSDIDDNRIIELKKRKKIIEEEIKRLEEEEKEIKIEIDERIVDKFINFLCISGFAVEYYGRLKFKIWVRGMPIEYAYIVFEINPELLTVNVEDAGGNFKRYRQGKNKEYFSTNIISIYYRAITEE